jgi:hypothetical protein
MKIPKVDENQSGKVPEGSGHWTVILNGFNL